MPFFGLFWVNYWLSYLFGHSQGLFRVPDYLTSTLPAKVLSVVGSPLETYNPLAIQASGASIPYTRQSIVKGYNPPLAALPKYDFQPGLGFGPSRSNQAQPSFQAVNTLDRLESGLCSPVLEQKKDSHQVEPKPPSHSESSPEESDKAASKSGFPRRIMQLMQNFFKWPERLEDGVKGKPKPEVAIRIGEDETPIEPPKSDVMVARRGFWLYSQLRPGRSASSHSRKELWPKILVNGRTIAQVPDWLQAKSIGESLHKILGDPNLDANQIHPAIVNGKPGGRLGDRILFSVEEAIAKELKRNPQLLAIEWVNNLRTALGTTSLTLVQAQSRMFGLVETENTFAGYASWYGDYFHGRPTATGEKFNQFALTAAHPSLPFDTYLKVTNLKSGNSVIVRVNDRGPYIPPRTLDLSLGAARCINSEDAGVVPYSAVVMQQLSTR